MTVPRELATPQDRRGELLREGWEERFTAAPPRLEEAIEVFRSAGFDVTLEPAAAPGALPACHACEPLAPGAVTIWVRRRA